MSFGQVIEKRDDIFFHQSDIPREMLLETFAEIGKVLSSSCGYSHDTSSFICLGSQNEHRPQRAIESIVHVGVGRKPGRRMKCTTVIWARLCPSNCLDRIHNVFGGPQYQFSG